jgi:hypothetical protein
MFDNLRRIAVGNVNTRLMVAVLCRAVLCRAVQFSFNYIAEDSRNSLKLLFRRRTDVMPPPPKVRLHSG